MNYLIAEGSSLIKHFESCKLTAYKLKGDPHWTCGWGSTINSKGLPFKEGDTLTQDEADQLFNIQIKSYVNQVRKALKVVVNDYQFSALVSYNYNRGYGNFLKSKVLTLVNVAPNDPAIEQAFLDVSMVKPQFQKGILLRRKEEYKLYKK